MKRLSWKTKRDLEMVALLAVLALLLALIVDSCTGTPDVYIDSVTKRCVKVRPVSTGSCDNLPKSYNVIWVAAAWIREPEDVMEVVK